MRRLPRGPWRRWREVVVVALVALRVEVALRRHGLEDVCGLMGVRLDLGVEESPAVVGGRLPARVRVSFFAVDQVMKQWPWGDTCLRRCLVLGHRIRHLRPVVRIGVRTTEDGALAVHSWLHVRGRDLDSGTGAFHTLKSGTVA
jgi:hypothetical protein